MPSVLEPSNVSLKVAAQALREGRAVAFPTETVYGLGALTLDPRGISEVYRLKRRPSNNPLIAHVLDGRAARALVDDWDPRCDELASRLWPGPLTLVVRRRPEVPAEAVGGRDTIAVRSPSHPVARRLLEELGGAAISAPSANRSGHVSPTVARHVAEDFAGEQDLIIIDGGRSEFGLESTVLDLSGRRPVLLRPGTVTLESLRSILGEVDAPTITEQGASPGTAARHYAPRTPAARVPTSGVSAALAREQRPCAVLCFDPAQVPAPHTAIGMPRDARLYASALYDALRSADSLGCARILVEMPPSSDGLWRAVVDRLTRATA
ncbi:MAG: L-threonylcarbamoyladenylate synthase [Planctomycetota bacterium]